MTTTTLPLPGRSGGGEVGSNFISWRFLAGQRIDPSLMQGNDPGFLQTLQLFTSASTSFLQIGAVDDQGLGGDAGPDLSSALESSPRALGFSAPHGSVVLPGPALWSTSDATEPYAGVLPGTARAALSTWLAGYQEGEALALTLDDDQGVDFRGVIDLGAPRVVADLAPVAELAGALNVGAPAIIGALAPGGDFEGAIRTGAVRLAADLFFQRLPGRVFGVVATPRQSAVDFSLEFDGGGSETTSVQYRIDSGEWINV